MTTSMLLRLYFHLRSVEYGLSSGWKGQPTLLLVLPIPLMDTFGKTPEIISLNPYLVLKVPLTRRGLSSKPGKVSSLTLEPMVDLSTSGEDGLKFLKYTKEWAQMIGSNSSLYPLVEQHSSVVSLFTKRTLKYLQRKV